MSHNYCIIMAGGVGSRFWPLSKTARPKQFLDILSSGRTLLQQTYDRFVNIIPNENILIVTNINYFSLVREQLPNISADQIYCEPSRRNTAPCAAYATYKVMEKDPEAKFIVTPADHLILNEPSFLTYLEKGLEFVAQNNNLLTLGITPSSPETGYGYIQISSRETVKKGNFYKVKTFTEKPEYELAKVFYESGEFFWNSGIFIWKGSDFIDALELHLPDLAAKFENGKGIYNTSNETQFIETVYASCKSISIDYGIMEHAKNVSVLCSEFGWSDLGSWGTLYEHSDKDGYGNALGNTSLLTYECSNNVIYLPNNKTAVLQGLEDFIVVESDNTLLICKKSEEQRIRKFVNDLKLEKGNHLV